MRQVKNLLKKCIHPALILCMFLIIIVGIIIIYNSKQNYATEAWVYECLEPYSDYLTQLDLDILAKELTIEIDQKLGEFDIDTELPEDQLIELMTIIDDKLQYTAYCVSQEEITALTARIVKKLISENASGSYATSHKITESIDELEKQLSEMKTVINKLKDDQKNIYSEEQIQEIVKATGLDEASIRKWITEIHSDIDFSAYDAAIEKLAGLLDMEASDLKKFAEQAANADDGIGYLINRLDITEEKLNNALQQLNKTDSRGLTELLSKLNMTEEDLQSQITNNMSLTINSITSVQNQVTNNRNETDATIASNKAETDKLISENKAETDRQISENRAETDRQISENKAYTDTAIDELQNNVLFYEYDKVTNTLKLFKKPEGGSKR